MSLIYQTFINQPFWYYIFLNLTVYEWVKLSIIVIIGVITSGLIAKKLNNGVIQIIQRFNRNIINNTELNHISLSTPLNIILVGWILLFGLYLINIPHQVMLILAVSAKLLSYIGSILFGWTFVDVIQIILLKRAEKTEGKFDDLLAPLVCRSLKILIVIIGILSIAEILKLPITSLIAGLGIGGIALAMAAKDTVANVFGSLTVLVDRPFSIGDWIKVSDIEGTVEHVGFRSTRVRTFDCSLVTVPNSLLVTAIVDNMGLRPLRRYKFYLGLVYETSSENVEKFCKGVREIITQDPNIDNDIIHSYFNGFGACSLDILVICYFKVNGYAEELEAKHHLLLNIMQLAKEIGVEFAFPTQTLFVEQTDANKSTQLDHN